MAARLGEGNDEVVGNDRPENTSIAQLVVLVNTMRKEMEERCIQIEDKFDGLDKRVAPLEAFVKEKLGDYSRVTVCVLKF